MGRDCIRRLWPTLLALGLVVSCRASTEPLALPREQAQPSQAGGDSQADPETASVAASASAEDAAVAAAGSGTSGEPRVTVTLAAIRELALVEWIWRQGKPGEIGLEGALRVTVTNTWQQPVMIKQLEVHGLVFIDVVTGTQHLIMNPSQCMRDFASPNDFTLTLAPGQSYEYAIDEWGAAGSMWQTPPPGRYRVVYRSLPGNDEMRAAAGEPGSLQVLTDCRDSLQSAEYWQHAVTSEPLEIVLETPTKRQLPP